MDIFAAYEMDNDAVNKGIWADIELLGKKIGAIRVRPSDPDLNPEYRKALSDMATLVMVRQKAGGEVSATELHEIIIETAASCILTDFELYQLDKDGKEVKIKYSKKKAVELMTKLPKLLKAVEQAAKGWTNFRKAAASEAVKA